MCPPMRASSKDQKRILRVATVVIAVALFMEITVSRHGFAAETDYVRFSKPDLLTFDELVELEQKDPPPPALAEKLQHLLTTPILSNEAYLEGAQPKRPSSPELGPFLRAICWNIERGIQFDPIRIALSEPEKFDQVLAATQKRRIPRLSL